MKCGKIGISIEHESLLPSNMEGNSQNGKKSAIFIPKSIVQLTKSSVKIGAILEKFYREISSAGSIKVISSK